jgi:toxin ParE1/3/4
MIEQEWRVRLCAAAELDFVNLVAWTTENFGARQSRIYRDRLVRAIRELANGPDVAGSKARDAIMPGLRMLHIARHGRRGRHFLLYRIGKGQVIEIGRILHGQLDLQRHADSQYPEGRILATCPP